MDARDSLIERIVKWWRIRKYGRHWLYDDPERMERALRTGIRYTDDELVALWQEAWDRGEPPLWSANEYKRAVELGLR